MKVRIIEIDGQVLVGMLSGHPMSAVTSDMPNDAQLLDVRPTSREGIWYLKVHSEAFEDVRNGYGLPVWKPTMQASYPTALGRISSQVEGLPVREFPVDDETSVFLVDREKVLAIIDGTPQD